MIRAHVYSMAWCVLGHLTVFSSSPIFSGYIEKVRSIGRVSDVTREDPLLSASTSITRKSHDPGRNTIATRSSSPITSFDS